eukprot:TRINITY_DN428_c3_g1_i2.p1 TRINITY_DN428_c3_g1~~TRINITY_DN428_c3_g1_i2.p1  ORF type:complete len:707 (+),score=169.53 TRINITY_DN428_c3_g1_i2:45-2165(+)
MGSCVSGQKVTQDREEPNAKRQSLLNADRIGDDPEGNVYSQDEDDALPGGMENEHPRSPMKQAKQVKTKDNSRCVHKKTVLDVFLDQKKATPASELAKLIELSRSQEYNSLRYGTAPLSLTSPHIAGILNGIKSSIDAVLYPILTASLDTVREEAEQNADDVSLQEISSAIASAVKTQIPSETAFQAGIQAGLFCVGWLAHGTPRYEPSSEVACCHYTDYYVASVNHLFSCTKNTLVQPSAGLMSSYQLDEGLEHLAVILHKMGVVHSESSWQAALPMFALDAITKGALLYIECNKNQKRLSLNPVRRHMVITDGSVLAKAAGLWSGVPSGALRQGGWAKHERVKQEHLKIFPAFEGSDGVIEYGEGHGPRKELFDLIAAAVTSPWSPEADLGKKCNGTLKAGSVTAFIAVTEGQDVTIPQWSMLVFGTPDGPFEAEVNKTERNKDVLKITLSKEAPVSCEAMPLALKLRVTPLFQGDSSGYWFREVEGLGMAETGDLTQDQLATLDMYGFTGWLLSQTIGNGVTMNLALPVIFYTMLKAWPNWDPTLQPLSALAPDIAASLSAIKALPHADFKEVLEVDGLPPTSKDEYIQKRIVDYLKNDIKNQMAAFAYGFCLTGVRQLPAFTACRPEELRLVLQGRGDDGVADFRFHEEFHILESQDFREGEHNKVFKEVLWEVIESGLGAEKGQVVCYMMWKKETTQHHRR